MSEKLTERMTIALDYESDIRELEARCIELEQHRSVLLALVEQVEWVAVSSIFSVFASNPQPLRLCPWCNAQQCEGHRPNCDRQATIARVRGAQ